MIIDGGRKRKREGGRERVIEKGREGKRGETRNKE